MTRITVTLHEDLYTFMIISRSILFRMRNVTEKYVENFKTRMLCWVNFFTKIVLFMRQCGKHDTARQARYDSKTSWPLKNEPKVCPETSSQNYHSTLRNIPEKRRSRLHRGGRLKLRSSLLSQVNVNSSCP
jgi:hypothetical protein